MINASDPHTRHVMQGQWHVSHTPNDVLTCILGSCVAACIRDPKLQIGGMNHFLLPGHDPRGGENVRYGARCMEDLINALMRRGANRTRLEVWLFGGASVLGKKTGIGAANCAFAKDFVRTEGFVLRGHDLGGTRGRRIKFTPFSGATDTALMRVALTEAPPQQKPAAQDIELF